MLKRRRFESEIEAIDSRSVAVAGERCCEMAMLERSKEETRHKAQEAQETIGPRDAIHAPVLDSA